MHQTRKMFFLERHTYNMSRFVAQKILDNTLKKLCCHQKFCGWAYKKLCTKKTYEMQVGSRESTADFKNCDRQFDWLEISLVYDKRDKHLTIYHSYNAKCAARIIKNIELSNISDGKVQQTL